MTISKIVFDKIAPRIHIFGVFACSIALILNVKLVRYHTIISIRMLIVKTNSGVAILVFISHLYKKDNPTLDK